MACPTFATCTKAFLFKLLRVLSVLVNICLHLVEKAFAMLAFFCKYVAANGMISSNRLRFIKENGHE